MSPFGYSDEIFKYPAVQYIPLDLYQERNVSTKTSGKTRFELYNNLMNDEFKQRLKNMNLNENYNIKKEQIGFIVKNGKVDIIKYRAHEVILAAEEKKGHHQVFKITTHYFYKDKIFFALYNAKTNERMDYKRYNNRINTIIP